jgi:PAS domain S-box-containing protein
VTSVLYYDPDPAWREAVGRDLALEAAVEILTAATFRDAISLARSGGVDAAAADPPGVEVIPFVSAVRQVRGPVPIVLFMPRERARDALDGMNSGADRFVEKREPAADRIGALANALRAGLGRRRSELGLEQRAEHLDLLSRTALEFIGMEDGDDIYDYIGRKLAEIVPGSMVGVASLDPEAEILTTRAVAGDPAELAALDEVLGGPFVGRELSIGSIPAAPVSFGCQGLVEGPSTTAALFFNQIPDELGARLDELFSWGRSYVMGFSCREGVLGNVTIRVRRGAEIENRELVEAFIGQASVALLRRVTRRRLLESEARYRAVVESQHELICRFRPDGTHLFANEAYCRFFGLDPATIAGSPFLPAVPQAERGALRDYFRGFSPGSPDGMIEHRVCLPDGTARWLHWSDRAFFDRDGRVEEFQSVGRDVTGRKEAEEALAALTAELEERVETATAELRVAIREIEAFSHHVSHDLRAPLRAIDGYLGILMARFGPDLDPDAVVLVGRAREGVLRAGRFLEGLLSLSRLTQQPLNLERVETAAIARAVLEELLPDPAARRVEVVVAPLPACRADPEMLRHVYENLLSNALKFTRTRDPAHIEVGGGDRGPESVYTVSDNGVGFPPEDASRIFDGFIRLHDRREYEGSGIGLPLVRRIVERHGGRCWAESTPGEGSTFFFTLPAA